MHRAAKYADLVAILIGHFIRTTYHLNALCRLSGCRWGQPLSRYYLGGDPYLAQQWYWHWSGMVVHGSEMIIHDTWQCYTKKKGQWMTNTLCLEKDKSLNIYLQCAPTNSVLRKYQPIPQLVPRALQSSFTLMMKWLWSTWRCKTQAFGTQFHPKHDRSLQPYVCYNPVYVLACWSLLPNNPRIV